MKPAGAATVAVFLSATALLAGATTAQPAAGTGTTAPRVPTCRRDNLSPASRTLSPVAVYRTRGQVTDPRAILSGGPTRLSGQGSQVVLDFGKDVAGIVTIHFPRASDNQQTLGLAFSESPNYVGPNSDASEIDDGSLRTRVNAPGSYRMPTAELRGGFRYLTLFLGSSGWVDFDRVSLGFTAAPGNPRPDHYPDYFCSSDQLLNRIWYAGAYTVQLDTIDPKQGHVWPPPATGWDNSGTVGVGASVLVDGAKRDRTVWPGDYGIEVPTDFASIDDMASARNGLTTLYEHQDPSGALPYAGPGIDFPGELSDTYSLWTLIATADYYLDTGDRVWLGSVWGQYRRAVQYALSKVGPDDLMVVTGPSDWGNGHVGETIEANALLYRVLRTGAWLARAESDASLGRSYDSAAARLRTAINHRLWDSSKGAYTNGNGSDAGAGGAVYPQDGNALAVWFGVPASRSRARRTLSYLRHNWNRFGAVAPEWNGDISPFPGSMEVYARFAAGADRSAVALIRREWGYMLDAPQGTHSTFWEGYHADGSLAYNPYTPGAPAGSYTSLAHGWSTGPTGALTHYVLGISPTEAGGSRYDVIPHPSGVRWAGGRLKMAAGTVTATWSCGPDRFSLSVQDSGSGTRGLVAVPRLGSDRVVYFDGKKAWNGTSFLGAPGIAGARQDATYIFFRGVRPGSRTFTWQG